MSGETISIVTISIVGIIFIFVLRKIFILLTSVQKSQINAEKETSKKLNNFDEQLKRLMEEAESQINAEKQISKVLDNLNEKLKRLIEEVEETQIKTDETISLKSERAGAGVNFKICKLKQLDPNERLHLTWETLGKGLEKLKKELGNAPIVAPDIIFGINETGIIAATYLSTQMGGEPHLGMIKTTPLKEGSRVIRQFTCPKDKVMQFKPPGYKDDEYPIREYPTVAKPRSIVIVDIEIKSGNSTKDIIDLLHNIYGRNVDIIYIVLCGIIKEEDKGKKIDDIKYFGWKTNDKKYKPDFIAFYVDLPGIRGPKGLR